MALTQIPEAFLFMKVGDHAGEGFAEIIQRKQRELDATGLSLWGYGGTTLHPGRVQAFAKLHLQTQGGIALLMEPMNSRAAPEILPATQMSIDGQTWEPIPAGINVLGSKYALVLDRLEPGTLAFSPDEYEVALGECAGRPASEYLRGRVDKGAFKKRATAAPASGESGKPRTIGLVAELKPPFGVFVRP